MKIIKYYVAIIFATLTIIPANAQVYSDGLIDKTIALIGNESVMLSQIEAEVQMMMIQGYTSDRNIRCQVLENILVQKLFLNQAKIDSIPPNLEQIESELSGRLNNVMSQLGGEKATEEYFKKPMYKLRQEWRSAIEEQVLTQEMQRDVVMSVTALTPYDVKKFFKKTSKDSLPIISTKYLMRQVVLHPMQDEAERVVKERLLEFRNRILKGEKFSTLASLYSDDPGTRIRGGELKMAAKINYWPEFSDAAMPLKPGQVSQIVRTPDGFHIIQMIEKEGDMFNARHILLSPKYTYEDRDKAFKTLDSLKTIIEGDSISFELAARIYSQDIKSRVNGGLMSEERSGSSYFEKDLIKPEDYRIVKDLEIGVISEPFESKDNEGRAGNTIYKIIKIEEIIPAHTATIETDYDILLNEANNLQSMEAIAEFIKEKQAITYIKIDPLFQKCIFEREGWLK